MHPATKPKLEYLFSLLVLILCRIYCAHKNSNTTPRLTHHLHQKLSCEYYRNHWFFSSSSSLGKNEKKPPFSLHDLEKEMVRSTLCGPLHE